MRIAFEGIKKGIRIFWDDSILLILLNFLCFLSLLPALLFFSVTVTNGSIITSIINTLLVFPFVFFLFALYYILFDCRQNIVISFKRYFGYLRQTWKQAFIYGSINLLVVLMVGWNLRFYAQFDEAWAGIIQLVFLSIVLIWVVLQIIMLPLYPRLEDSKFKLVFQNAAAIFGRYLLPVLALFLWTALFMALTVYLQVLGMLFSIVFIAVLGEGIIGQIIIDVNGSQDHLDTLKE